MIEATHHAEVRTTQVPSTGTVWGATTLAATETAGVFLEPLSSEADADRFGVDLERRYRLMLNLSDEARFPQGAVFRARPKASAPWVYYRVEKPPLRHEAGDECDHAEAAAERLEKYAGWA